MRRLTRDQLKRCFEKGDEFRASFAHDNNIRKQALLRWASGLESAPVSEPPEETYAPSGKKQVQVVNVVSQSQQIDLTPKIMIFEDLSARKTIPPVSMTKSRLYRILAKIPGIKGIIVALYNAYTFPARRLAAQIVVMLREQQNQSLTPSHFKTDG